LNADRTKNCNFNGKLFFINLVNDFMLMESWFAVGCGYEFVFGGFEIWDGFQFL
jgi:hypothetical protein